MSSVIAVAGATGGLGRAIVDALKLKANTSFTVIVLSRENSKTKEEEIGARIVAADYNNPAGLAEVLENNNIDTVISTLTSMTGDGLEIALIDAAQKSRTTKRYIPSIWDVPYNSDVFPVFPIAKAKVDILAHLATTTLEFTAFYNGIFFDYYVPQVPTYLKPFALILDMPNNAAAVPGSGDIPIVFTHTWDIAKFVAAYVAKPQWDPEAYIIGDKLTCNELVRSAEEAKGIKFSVSYDPMEDLLAGKVTELPSQVQVYPFFPKEAVQRMCAGLGWLMQNRYYDFKPKRTLNQEVESIKARGCKELLASWQN